MAWSYTGNPASSDRDRVRFWIRDTNSKDPLLRDEEIDFLIAEAETLRWAAVDALDAILTELAKHVTKSVGQFSLSASDKYKQLKELRPGLVARAAAEQPREARPATPLWNMATPEDPIFSRHIGERGVGLEPRWPPYDDPVWNP